MNEQDHRTFSDAEIQLEIDILRLMSRSEYCTKYRKGLSDDCANLLLTLAGKMNGTQYYHRTFSDEEIQLEIDILNLMIRSEYRTKYRKSQSNCANLLLTLAARMNATSATN